MKYNSKLYENYRKGFGLYQQMYSHRLNRTSYLFLNERNVAACLYLGGFLLILANLIACFGYDNSKIINQLACFLILISSTIFYTTGLGKTQNLIIYHCLIIFYVWLALLGIVEGNYFSHYANDVLIFGMLLVISVGRHIAITDKILRLFHALLPVIALSVLYNSTIMYSGLVGDTRYSDSNMVYMVRENIELLYPAILFLFQYSKNSRISKISIILSISLMFYAGFRTATREFFVLALLAVVFSIFAYKNSLLKRKARVLFISVVFLSVPFVIISLSTTSRYENIFVVERLFATKNMISFNTNDQEYRLYETETLFDRFSLLEKITGRGLGSSQQIGIFRKVEHGIAMTHLGIGHLIMKGGLIFLGLFTILPLYVVFKSLRTKDPVLVRNSLWIILFLSRSFFMHTAFTLNLSFFLFCILMGQSLQLIETKQYSKYV